MSEQIKLLRKNILDLDNPNASIMVTDNTASDDGAGFIDFLRNRKNSSGWATADSNDAALTQLDFFFGDTEFVSQIILVAHNFKNYTIQYLDIDTSTFVDFSTPANVINNTVDVTSHDFDRVQTKQIRLIIQNTIDVDDDKIMSQVVISEGILAGNILSETPTVKNQLEGWPVIKKPRHGTIKKVLKMDSGRIHLVEQNGAFSCQLTVKVTSISEDLFMFQDIYDQREGVLLWITGGDESQFNANLRGYRNRDIFLVRPTKDYENEFYKGQYQNGTIVKLSLTESRI